MSPFFRGSRIGSNHLDPLTITYPSGSSEQHTTDKSASQQQHKKKRSVPKKLTPNKASPAMSTRSKAPSSPSSPAMGTRSKKKLDLWWVCISMACFCSTLGLHDQTMFKLVMMLMWPSFVFELYFVIKLTMYVDDNFRPRLCLNVFWLSQLSNFYLLELS